MEKYGRQFADGKDRKKKKSAKQDYQDSDLGMQQSKCCALPLGDSPKGRVDTGIRTLGLQSHNLAR